MPAGIYGLYNVALTSMQRYIEFIVTFYKRHVPAGKIYTNS